MDILLETFKGISEELRSWISFLLEGKKEKKQEVREALEAISNAVLETRTYLGKITRGRDFEKEELLSDMWNDAHMKLKDVNFELANRCFIKADYWADPNKWTTELIHECNITLDSMAEEVRRFKQK